MSRSEQGLDVLHQQLWREFHKAEAAYEAREHPDFDRVEDSCSDEEYAARLDRLLGGGGIR